MDVAEVVNTVCVITSNGSACSENIPSRQLIIKNIILHIIGASNENHRKSTLILYSMRSVKQSGYARNSIPFDD